MHVVEPLAAGLDVHKLQITASTRLCRPDGGEPLCATREFATTPHGLAELTDWLVDQQVDAVAMEGTGVYWEPPYTALESAGLRVSLYNAQQVKQLRGRKTDRKDARWLACVCQFGLGSPSFIPPLAFRDLRRMTRNRRQLVEDRSRARNRIHKLLDRSGLPLGGVLTDIFGRNGRHVLDGLAAALPVEEILQGLSTHVRAKRKALAALLTVDLHAEARAQLRGHLRACDYATELVAEQDRRIAAASAPWSRQLDLLETWASTGPAPVRCWPRSVPTRTKTSRARTASPPGRASARTTTSPLASAALGAPAKAAGTCVSPWPNAPTVLCAPRAHNSLASTSTWQRTEATSGRFSPQRTNSCAPSTPCCATTTITATQASTTSNSKSNATHRAGWRS